MGTGRKDSDGRWTTATLGRRTRKLQKNEVPGPQASSGGVRFEGALSCNDRGMMNDRFALKPAAR